MSTDRTKKHRLRLFKKQGGKCYWCGKPMKIEPDGSAKPKKGYATIDHIHPRGHPERGQHPNGETHVLACRGCNHDRNIQFLRSLPKEALWKASGRAPSTSTAEHGK